MAREWWITVRQKRRGWLAPRWSIELVGRDGQRQWLCYKRVWTEAQEEALSWWHAIDSGKVRLPW